MTKEIFSSQSPEKLLSFPAILIPQSKSPSALFALKVQLKKKKKAYTEAAYQSL